MTLGRLLLAIVLAATPAGASAAPAPAPAHEAAQKPGAPLPADVQVLIKSKELEVAQVRREAIKLLQGYLGEVGGARSDETAEALFKLAELIWEESQADYMARMGEHLEAVAACKEDRERCTPAARKQPRLDLSRAQSTYARLIREYPKFRKIDTVIYLYAFSLRDEGKLEEAVGYFKRLLQEFPRSRFRADAWMALAEYRFYERQDFTAALHAYDQVVKFPGSPLFGLALFKSAWCQWKLGRGDLAAARFKEVLDLGAKAANRSLDEQKRAAELQDQALEYLVDLFTEDDTKSAEDAYAFLAQIGGKAYSRKLMRRLADTVYDQTRYERAAQAYLFVLGQEPTQLDAPELQRRGVESFQALGQGDRANVEMRKLATDYGKGSAWARANADHPEALAEARAVAEKFIRTQAKTLHAQAQRNEKESHVVDRERYTHAAEAYEFYVAQFPDAKDATELRYLRADILYFKLKDLRGAGREYLEVGRSKPVGQYHKEALLQAMNAFEKLRPPAPAGSRRKRDVTDDDRRFAESADLYATLFPNDKEIITVIFKNGQFFYDYGDYDEAIKRFGLIIERYPASPVAGPAGDKLLECLGAAKDYENIETWARRLKKTQAFSGKAEQARLDELIAGSMLKSGEGYVAQGTTASYEKAAEFFERAAREYPGSTAAPKALANAGAAFEKAGRPERAVAAYKALADRYPRASEAPGALLVAAKIEESIAAFGAAAALYEQLATRYPQSPEAPAALRSAGLLRQTLGQSDRAVAHYAAFEKQYKGRAETRDVAFQKGLLMAEKKDYKGAAAAFADFTRSYGDDPRVIEAWVREAEAHLKLGATAKAKEALARALASHRAHRRDETALYAAQARYLQGEVLYHDYEAIKIAGKPRQLARSLEEKAKLLDEARKVYLDVVSFRVPEWATAALYRIGQAYASYAKAIRGAKVPRDLSKDEQQIYRDELEKSVVVIEDKALEAYRSGYAKALEIGVYNKYTRALRQALAELDQGQFPRDAEARTAPRLGEGTSVAWEPIEEIRR